MRDLEKQIASWRHTMTQASGRRGDVLDELEMHLRDEIDRLLRAGTASDKVFDIALGNLGAPSGLAAEFNKLLRSRHAHWLPVRLARVLAVAGTLVMPLFLVLKFGNPRMDILLVSHAFSITLGYGLMFIIGGLGICSVGARWFHDPGPSQRYSALRSMLQFANLAAVCVGLGIVLGMFWAKAHLGRYWAWDAKETGGLVVFSWTLLLSAGRFIKAADGLPVMLLGILGNAVTAWAWFGTNPGSKSSPLLATFVASQVLLFLVAFALPADLLKKQGARRAD